MGQDPRRPWWAPDLQATVALAIVAIVAAALFFRMTHPTQVEDKQLDTMLTIVFSTALVAIINFLFGSSRSSQSKDDTLASIASMPTTVVAPSPSPTPPSPAEPAAPAANP